MAKKIKTESEAESDFMKSFGTDLFLSEDMLQDKVDYIPTGSPALDFALGIGGLPRGRIIQIAGKESSGKTLTSFLAIAEYQRQHPKNNALFIDAEFTYNADWVRKLGADPTRIRVLRSNDAKDIFTKLLGRNKINKLTGVAKHEAGILDLIREDDGSNQYFNKHTGIIVLDSVAVLQTPIDMYAEIGKQNMAPLPRFLSSELKKLTPEVERANVCFIAINQLRSDLGAISPVAVESSPGGRAFKHACSVMISVRKLLAKDTLILNDYDEPIGHTIKAKIEKNKLGTPGREALYQIEYLKGNVNQAKELLDLGLRLGVFEAASTVSTIIDGVKYTSKPAAIAQLSKPEVYKTELERVVKFYRENPDAELAGPSSLVESSDNDDDYVDEDAYVNEEEGE